MIQLKIVYISKVHFIIMQSVFWPSSGIYERYDIKGCISGRKEERPEELSEFNELVMKDANVLDVSIDLGSNQKW